MIPDPVIIIHPKLFNQEKSYYQNRKPLQDPRSHISISSSKPTTTTLTRSQKATTMRTLLKPQKVPPRLLMIYSDPGMLVFKSRQDLEWHIHHPTQ
jgi:hypothetical protein